MVSIGEVTVEEMATALRFIAENLCANSPQLEEHVTAARDFILAAGKEIAEMRAVTGPRCPLCNHWLKAEHLVPRDYTETYSAVVCQQCGPHNHCVIYVVDLLANHPDIAAEMGLSQ